MVELCVKHGEINHKYGMNGYNYRCDDMVWYGLTGIMVEQSSHDMPCGLKRGWEIPALKGGWSLGKPTVNMGITGITMGF